jgi:lipopolysaccharide/colanic/teichoic acid biosynthesis glycosyltransferase
LKRILDILIVVAIILPSILFMGILSILIICIDRYSPFYSQIRLGKNGKQFRCYKLQTMRPAKNAEEIGNKAKDTLRVTKLGNFLRNRGWDEIPQILNILLGQMSFIGPRPLRARLIEIIREENKEMKRTIEVWENARSKVRPGLTGWNQVRYIFDKSIIYDELEYFKKPCPKNFKISIVTFLIFLKGKEWYRDKKGRP